MSVAPANWRENKRFCLIYPLVLKVEGGYVWNKKDKGGATNHGVAYNYHYLNLKQYGIYGPSDMPKLTKEQAIDFYYRYFWVPSQADEIPDAKLALIYFDLAVNSGITQANELMARIPDKKFMYYKGDGHNVRLFWFLTTYLIGQRLMFYTNIRQWKDFGMGWTRRMAHLCMELDKVDVGG